MRSDSVKLGNTNLPFSAFLTSKKKAKISYAPSINSRNYIDSLPMTHYVPFDASQSVYKFYTMTHDHKRVIAANTENFCHSNTMNKKMKSDLLSTHFTMGNPVAANPSESQSNFYKKKSDAAKMALLRAKLKTKIERQNFAINK